MALSLIQSVGPWNQVGSFDPGNGYLATGSSTYTSGSISVGANSILVVRIAVGSESIPTVTGITNTGTALTWVKVTGNSPPSNGDEECSIWYALNTSAQTITYTVTWTESNTNYTGYCRGYFQEFTGHDTSDPFDYEESGQSSGGNTAVGAVDYVTGNRPMIVATDQSTSQTLTAQHGDIGVGVTDFTEVRDTTNNTVWGGFSTAGVGPSNVYIQTTGASTLRRWAYAALQQATSTTHSATATPSVTATAAGAAALSRPLAATPSATASAAATGYLSKTSAATLTATASASVEASVGLSLPADAAPSVTASATASMDRTVGLAAAPSVTASATSDAGIAGYVEIAAAPSVSATAEADADTYTPGELDGDAALQADATIAATAYLARICATDSTVTATCTAVLVNGDIASPGFLRSEITSNAALEGV